MIQRIAIAFGAGVVSVLLFAVTVKGTLLAIALAYLAPLPIVIASLGWGVDMGAIAAATACGGVAALIDPLSGALFGASVALPAWLLSALCCARAFRLGRAKDNVAEPRPWFPVGLIVTAAAVVGVLIGLGALLSLVILYGGYQQGVEALVNQVTPDIQEALNEVFALPSGMTVEEFATLVVRMSPLMLAAATFLMLCANLYLGARVAEISQLLKRPWASLPESLVLPWALGAALVLCLGLALTIRDPERQAAWIGVGALAAAFALQGLALAHALTRGLQIRNPLLFALYLVCALAPRWAVPALTFAGLMESFLSLRARRVAAANAKS
jgi:Predicted membrane protein (DUF2232)